MDDQSPSFADQLVRYRLRAGLSQEELAERSGLSVSAISALERGARQRPYPHTRQQLARALGLAGEEAASFGAPPRERLRAAAPGAGGSTTPAHGNLPAPRAPLIGREDASAKLVELVRHDPGRLVTLTGVGGCGKTSLALGVAAELRTSFSGGVWLVELAPVADAALLVPAIVAALGLRQVSDVPPLDALLAWLRRQPLLLLLDNCEHLIDACAELAERLLSRCAELRILATSREPLQIPGERQWRVPPLETPEPRDGATAAEVAAYPAARLFVARAQAVASGFRLTDANAGDVARICARLSGLPLALELAAARARVLSSAQILGRLDDAIHLLTTGSRAAPTRQQTLRAAVAWSYDLLSLSERRAFTRLAVFAGDCDLEAAEAVCGGPDLPAGEVLDLLTHLVDKSMLQADASGPAVRYGLLEPLRQFALGILGDGDELGPARARHAAYYLDLAEDVEPNLHGPEQIAWLDCLELEQDNLRAALHWCETERELQVGLRLAVALAPYWEARGRLGEGRRWLQALRTQPAFETLPEGLSERALLAEGRLAHWQGDATAALALLESALALARPRDDLSVVVEALAFTGVVLRQQSELARSSQVLEECLRLAQGTGDERLIALALLILGVTVRAQGGAARSVELTQQSLHGFERLGDLRWIATTQTMLGASLIRRGDLDQAARVLLAGLAGHLAVGDLTFSVWGLLCLAFVLAERDQSEWAARVLGAMLAMGERVGAGLSPDTRQDYDRIAEGVRGRLGAHAFERELAAGRGLTLEQVLAELSGVLPDAAG